MEEDPCGGVQVNANPNSLPQTHDSCRVLVVLQGLWDRGGRRELFVLLLPACKGGAPRAPSPSTICSRVFSRREKQCSRTVLCCSQFDLKVWVTFLLQEMLQDEVKLKFSQSFKIFPHVGPCLAATLKRNLSQKEPAGCPVLRRVCMPGQTWECPNLQLLSRGSGGAALMSAL